MKRFALEIFGLLIVVAIGCAHSRDNGPNPNSGIRDYNELELNRLLAAGTAIAAVTNEFGQPASFTSEGSNSIVYMYSYAFKSDRDRPFIAFLLTKKP